MKHTPNPISRGKQPIPTSALVVIALVMMALGALLPAQGTMSADMVTAQTGPSVSVEQIVAGDRVLEQTSCLNSADHQGPQDHDCQLCCVLPPLSDIAALTIMQPDLAVVTMAYSPRGHDLGTALPPQAYQGRAPPFPV